MKNFVVFALVSALMLPLIAQEEQSDVFTSKPTIATTHKKAGVWPAPFAICNFPFADSTPDIIGLRLTIPASWTHESVTGIDLGIWGSTRYFEGFMFNVLRNKAVDRLAGLQVGLYNTAGQADLIGVQLGLWNEAGSICGLQLGFINVADIAEGFQIGFINRAEEMYGFQFGLINVIRDAEIQFCPIMNIGF